MRKTALVLLALLVSQAATAGTAFLVRQYVSGMHRICIYNHLGSEVAITIQSYQLCPLTIEV